MTFRHHYGHLPSRSGIPVTTTLRFLLDISYNARWTSKATLVETCVLSGTMSASVVFPVKRLTPTLFWILLKKLVFTVVFNLVCSFLWRTRRVRPVFLPWVVRGTRCRGPLRCQRGVICTFPCFCHYSAWACSQPTLPAPAGCVPQLMDPNYLARGRFQAAESQLLLYWRPKSI